MRKIDQQAHADRYHRYLAEFGYSPRSLGWGKYGRQELRFSILAPQVIEEQSSSVLDVGCGFADLYDFLKTRGWDGRYVGVEFVPGLAKIAKERHPEVEIQNIDFGEFLKTERQFDFVIASGIFNLKLSQQDNLAYIVDTITCMHQFALRAVCVDFLSTWVDFRSDEAWHTDPAWAAELAKSLCPRFALRHDYMPYEFALFLFKNRAISNQNVYADFSKGGGLG